MNMSNSLTSKDNQTARALLAMRDDIAVLTETAERIRVQYAALALRHGVDQADTAHAANHR
jgi:hypothetical protein